MISVVDKYFSLNRTLLMIVGLWPYQRSKFTRIYLFCCFSIVITFIIFQFTTFLTSKCTIDHIIKILSTSSGIIAIAIKYNSFFVNSNTIKNLMEQLQCIQNDLKDNNEIAIIEKYGKIGKYYTLFFTISLFCGLFVVIGSQLWPDFIDIIVSTNKSRSHHLKISTEYFIDQEKYYYVLLLHINVALCIGVIVIVATGTTLLGYLFHVCGMFKIASYRIKNAIRIYILRIDLKDKNLLHKDLIYGVHIHRKAVTFSEYIISRFEKSFMFLIIFGVMTLTLNAFRILSSGCKIADLLMTFVMIFISLLYMFLANFIGQKIMDHYDLIFYAAYEIQWYITPMYVQKFILFLLLRGNKSFGLNVGGLFTSSLQCFATLTNASLSYFIVMYSMG